MATSRLERLSETYRGHQSASEEFNPVELRALLHDFAGVRTAFAVGRYVRYHHPALMGRVIVITGTKSA